MSQKLSLKHFQLFAEEETEFPGQIIGAIIANNFKTAYEAARMVKVVYSNVKKPKFDMKEIIHEGDKTRILKQFELPATATKREYCSCLR